MWVVLSLIISLEINISGRGSQIFNWFLIHFWKRYAIPSLSWLEHISSFSKNKWKCLAAKIGFPLENQCFWSISLVGKDRGSQILEFCICLRSVWVRDIWVLLQKINFSGWIAWLLLGNLYFWPGSLAGKVRVPQIFGSVFFFCQEVYVFSIGFDKTFWVS